MPRLSCSGRMIFPSNEGVGSNRDSFCSSYTNPICLYGFLLERIATSLVIDEDE